jgi:hypothetical protein
MPVRFQVSVNCRIVNARLPPRRRTVWLRWKEKLVELPVIVFLRQRPLQTRRRSHLQISMNGGLTDRATAGNLVLIETRSKPQP